MAARILSRSGLLVALACSAPGCGSPALVQCRVEAVRFLPEDPRQLTFADVSDLTVRLHRCNVQLGDAGHE